MRNAFINTLIALAEKDERIVFLTADLGFSVVEAFAERFPERFYNVGVCEQNMLAMATGLAEAGLIPFVYSIAPFVTLRPYEFIRNGAVLHHLPVRMVGVGAGFAYGDLGTTHHLFEDLALMRAHPGLTTVIPADEAQAIQALKETYDAPQPIYYRLGKNASECIDALEGYFTLGRAYLQEAGGDVALISMGTVAREAARACAVLEEQQRSTSLAIISSLNPSPDADLIAFIRKHRTIITLEDHAIQGGMGSYVAELIAEHQLPCKLIRKGVNAAPDGVLGSESFMLSRFGLTAAQIIETVQSVMHANAEVSL